MDRLISFLARPWGTIIAMHIASLFGRPYFKVFLVRTRDGNIGIDAHFNTHFLYELDNMYERADAEHYDRRMEDQAKVAIYMYDSIGNIADQYLPEPEIQEVVEDIAADVPPLAYRGGEEVRQVVDLAGPKGGKSSLDIEMG